MWTMFGWLRADAARASWRNLSLSGKARASAQNFDRHRTLQADVMRLVHFAHTAPSEQFLDFVGADSCAGSQDGRGYRGPPDRLFQQSVGLAFVREQGVYFAAQFRVAAACGIKK